MPNMQMYQRAGRGTVGALAQAVSVFLYRLDRALGKNLEWSHNLLGFSFHVYSHRELENQFIVEIVPAGWPKGSFISCLFFRSRGDKGEIWLVRDGYICAPHLEAGTENDFDASRVEICRKGNPGGKFTSHLPWG